MVVETQFTDLKREIVPAHEPLCAPSLQQIMEGLNTDTQ